MQWRFLDQMGQWREGSFERFSDYGGTDVTYWFRDTTDNSLHLVSGQHLKQSYPIHNPTQEI